MDIWQDDIVKTILYQRGLKDKQVTNVLSYLDYLSKCKGEDNNILYVDEDILVKKTGLSKNRIGYLLYDLEQIGILQSKQIVYCDRCKKIVAEYIYITELPDSVECRWCGKIYKGLESVRMVWYVVD